MLSTGRFGTREGSERFIDVYRRGYRSSCSSGTNGLRWRGLVNMGFLLIYEQDSHLESVFGFGVFPMVAVAYLSTL